MDLLLQGRQNRKREKEPIYKGTIISLCSFKIQLKEHVGLIIIGPFGYFS